MSANIVAVGEESLRKDIRNLVRRTVEETLNALVYEEVAGCVYIEASVHQVADERLFGCELQCPKLFRLGVQGGKKVR